MGSLPPGLAWPSRSFAVEVLPSWPGYHISRTAFTLLSQGKSTGSPLLSTTIVLGLAWATTATFAALAAATAALRVSPKRDQVSRKVSGGVRGIGVPTLLGQTVLRGMA